jgi:hypothetical protein
MQDTRRLWRTCYVKADKKAVKPGDRRQEGPVSVDTRHGVASPFTAALPDPAYTPGQVGQCRPNDATEYDASGPRVGTKAIEE